MRIVLIDHYDSFTFNVLEWLRGSAATEPKPGRTHPLEVMRIPWDQGESIRKIYGDVTSPNPYLPALVLGPGPNRPQDVPKTVSLVHQLIGIIPIFGICLGHQILAELAGRTLRRSQHAHHGTTRCIRLLAHSPGLVGVGETFRAATYNSLVASDEGFAAASRDRSMGLPESVDGSRSSDGWRVVGICEHGEVQAISREVAGEAPALGVQFHPESFLSEQSEAMRQAWLQVTLEWQTATSKNFHINSDLYSSTTAPLSMPS